MLPAAYLPPYELVRSLEALSAIYMPAIDGIREGLNESDFMKPQVQILLSILEKLVAHDQPVISLLPLDDLSIYGRQGGQGGGHDQGDRLMYGRGDHVSVAYFDRKMVTTPCVQDMLVELAYELVQRARADSAGSIRPILDVLPAKLGNFQTLSLHERLDSELFQTRQAIDMIVDLADNDLWIEPATTDLHTRVMMLKLYLEAVKRLAGVKSSKLVFGTTEGVTSLQLTRFNDWLETADVINSYFGSYFSNVPLVRRLKVESPTGHWSLGMHPSWRRLRYQDVTVNTSIDEWQIPTVCVRDTSDDVNPGEYRTSRELREAGLMISLPVFAAERSVWNLAEETINMRGSVREYNEHTINEIVVNALTLEALPGLVTPEAMRYNIAPLRSGMMRQAMMGQNPYTEVSVEVINSDVCFAKSFAGREAHFDHVPYKIRSASQEMTMPLVIS